MRPVRRSRHSRGPYDGYETPSPITSGRRRGGCQTEGTGCSACRTVSRSDVHIRGEEGGILAPGRRNVRWYGRRRRKAPRAKGRVNGREWFRVWELGVARPSSV